MLSYTKYAKLFSTSIASCVARSTGRFPRRVSEENSTKSRKSQTLTWPQEIKHSPRNFHGGFIKGIVNFYSSYAISPVLHIRLVE